MPLRRIRTVLLGALLAVLPSLAAAVEFGEVAIESSMQQPLRAWVPLAGPAGHGTRFEATGIQPSWSTPMQLEATLVQRAGRAAVLITSRKPITEPVLWLYVSQPSDPQAEKMYTVLLDAPAAAPAVARQMRKAATPSAPAVTTAAPRKPARVEAAAVPPATRAAATPIHSTATAQQPAPAPSPRSEQAAAALPEAAAPAAPRASASTRADTESAVAAVPARKRRWTAAFILAVRDWWGSWELSMPSSSSRKGREDRLAPGVPLPLVAGLGLILLGLTYFKRTAAPVRAAARRRPGGATRVATTAARSSAPATVDWIPPETRADAAATVAADFDAPPAELMTEIVTLIRSTLKAQPTRADLQMKLFEIYRALGLKREFRDEAARVSADRAMNDRLDWNTLHALWQEFAPGEGLLTSAATAKPAVSAVGAPAQRRFADAALEIAAAPLEALAAQYAALRHRPDFLPELVRRAAPLLGRPTPLVPIRNYSKAVGGAQLFLKREDQRRVGHEMDNAVVQALIARTLGKTLLITGNDTPAHSIALATVAKRLSMGCIVYCSSADLSGASDLTTALHALGARVEVADALCQLTDDPREAALRGWVGESAGFLALSLGTGPHPYPTLIGDGQALLGREARAQFRVAMPGKQPAALVASANGGTDGIGFVLPFLIDHQAEIAFVERGAAAATADFARNSTYNGMRREHAWLQASGRVEYVSVDPDAARQAQDDVESLEGIRIGDDDGEALAHARQLAANLPPDRGVIVLIA